MNPSTYALVFIVCVIIVAALLPAEHVHWPKK